MMHLNEQIYIQSVIENQMSYALNDSNNFILINQKINLQYNTTDI